MPKIYQVRVKDQAGGLTGIFTGERKGFYRFYYLRSVNTCGTFSLAFSKMADETEDEFITRTDVFELDGRVEFWWRWLEQDIDWHLDAAYFVRDVQYYLTAEGALTYQIMGRGFLDLMNRRVVRRGSTGTPSYNKTGVVETVLKELVTEQAVEGGSDWARGIYNFTVEADEARGPVIPVTSLNRVLYQVLYHDTIDVSSYYDIEAVGDDAFELKWFYPYRGDDRTGEVLFAYKHGNMTQASLAISRHDEVTAILAGGKGTGDDRDYLWVTDDARLAESPWNRIEEFRNVSNVENTADYESWANRRLDEMRPRKSLTFKALQTPGCLLGKHYFFGDLVASEFMGFSQDKMVSAYSVVESPSRKDLSVELKDV